MDAFSLALIYGMLGLNAKKKILLSLIVGTFHFIMPLIGLEFGKIITKNDLVSLDLVAAIILICIGLDLIISSFSNKNDYFKNSTIGFFMFGLSVSLDSLSIGTCLTVITSSYYLPSIIFSILSSLFTYIGLILGNVIERKVGSYSKTVGGIILIFIAIAIFIM